MQEGQAANCGFRIRTADSRTDCSNLGCAQEVQVSGLPLHRSDVASLGGIARSTLMRKNAHRCRLMRARVCMCPCATGSISSMRAAFIRRNVLREEVAHLFCARSPRRRARCAGDLSARGRISIERARGAQGRSEDELSALTLSNAMGAGCKLKARVVRHATKP